MKILTMISCSFTKLGIIYYMPLVEVEDFHFITALNIEQFCFKFKELNPDIIFIEEELLSANNMHKNDFKKLISDNPKTIFFVLVSSTSIQFDSYMLVRHNLVFVSKSANFFTLNFLYRSYFNAVSNNKNSLTSFIKELFFYVKTSPVTFSKKESHILNMWMRGVDAFHISEALGITEKTVSIHKFNIKCRLKIYNKMVIFRIVRLTDTITSGFYVNLK